MCACRARTCRASAVCAAHLCMESLGTLLPRACCAHARKHHKQQAALRCPCATAELRRYKQGCIKHGRIPSQGADLTLLNLSQDPTPPLTSPLDPACDAAIILWLTWEKCPTSLPSSAGEVPGQIPTMHTVRRGLRALPANFGIFKVYPSLTLRDRDWRGRGGLNPCPWISLVLQQRCVWSESLAGKKCRDVGRDVVRCDHLLGAWFWIFENVYGSFWPSK